MRTKGASRRPSLVRTPLTAAGRIRAIRSDAPVAALSRARGAPPREETQRKLDHLLSVAAGLIARQGYEQTAIRDVGRESGVSLAGMYYYFKGKEELLYQIQYRTFSSLLEAQEQAVAAGGTAEERLSRLVYGHLSFFERHPDELKVCTFELESLGNRLYRNVEELRHRYYKLVLDVVEEIVKERSNGRRRRGYASRHQTLFLFGMLNWVFMWFDKERDGPVEHLAEEMVDMVLCGLTGAERRA